MGQAETVNQALIDIYSGGRQITFNTLRQWNELGKKIKKGSKAFAVWARPKKIQKPEPDNAEEMQYFPICYLFSEEQVEDMPADGVQEMPTRYGCREIEVRYRPTKIASVHEKVSSSRQGYETFLMFFDLGTMQHHESFWVLFLNTAHNPIGAMKIGQGGISSTTADNRIMLQTALKVHASCMMVAHNLPSGSLTPSKADIEFTDKLKKGAKTVDIVLLDHIIMTATDYYSFADHGKL